MDHLNNENYGAGCWTQLKSVIIFWFRRCCCCFKNRPFEPSDSGSSSDSNSVSGSESSTNNLPSYLIDWIETALSEQDPKLSLRTAQPDFDKVWTEGIINPIKGIKSSSESDNVVPNLELEPKLSLCTHCLLFCVECGTMKKIGFVLLFISLITGMVLVIVFTCSAKEHEEKGEDSERNEEGNFFSAAVKSRKRNFSAILRRHVMGLKAEVEVGNLGGDSDSEKSKDYGNRIVLEKIEQELRLKVKQSNQSGSEIVTLRQSQKLTSLPKLSTYEYVGFLGTIQPTSYSAKYKEDEPQSGSDSTFKPPSSTSKHSEPKSVTENDQVEDGDGDSSPIRTQTKFEHESSSITDLHIFRFMGYKLDSTSNQADRQNVHINDADETRSNPNLTKTLSLGNINTNPNREVTVKSDRLSVNTTTPSESASQFQRQTLFGVGNLGTGYNNVSLNRSQTEPLLGVGNFGTGYNNVSPNKSQTEPANSLRPLNNQIETTAQPLGIFYAVPLSECAKDAHLWGLLNKSIKDGNTNFNPIASLRDDDPDAESWYYDHDNECSESDNEFESNHNASRSGKSNDNDITTKDFDESDDGGDEISEVQDETSLLKLNKLNKAKPRSFNNFKSGSGPGSRSHNRSGDSNSYCPSIQVGEPDSHSVQTRDLKQRLEGDHPDESDKLERSSIQSDSHSESDTESLRGQTETHNVENHNGNQTQTHGIDMTGHGPVFKVASDTDSESK